MFGRVFFIPLHCRLFSRKHNQRKVSAFVSNDSQGPGFWVRHFLDFSRSKILEHKKDASSGFDSFEQSFPNDVPDCKIDARGSLWFLLQKARQ